MPNEFLSRQARQDIGIGEASRSYQSYRTYLLQRTHHSPHWTWHDTRLGSNAGVPQKPRGITEMEYAHTP